MKNTIDVTEKIIELYEQDIKEKIGYKFDDLILERQVARAMAFVEKEKKSPKLNTGDFNSVKDKVIDFLTLFEGELPLAAASEKSENSKWYEQIIPISAINDEDGFTLEINQLGKGSKEVRVTILPKLGSEALLNKLLAPYAGQQIDISINNNGKTLVSVDMYVFPDADEAEGVGVIVDDYQPSDGNLKIGLIQKK